MCVHLEQVNFQIDQIVHRMKSNLVNILDNFRNPGLRVRSGIGHKVTLLPFKGQVLAVSVVRAE